MKDSRKILAGSIISVAVLAGLFAITYEGMVGQSSEDRDYKHLLGSLDSSIKSLRNEDNPYNSLKRASNLYDRIVLAKYERREFDNNQKWINLDNEINSKLDSAVKTWRNYRLNAAYLKQVYSGDQYQKYEDQLYSNARSSASESMIKDIRSDVMKIEVALGVNLPIVYKHAILILLAISVPLAFLSTVACREFIDWEKYREDKKSAKEWEEKINEAERKRGKKKRKLEVEGEEIVGERKRIWEVSFKQAIIYLGPFLVVLAWLSYVFSDWVVAWLPFAWLYSIPFIGVSLGVLGWFLFVYLGFSQIWRIALVPERRTD